MLRPRGKAFKAAKQVVPFLRKKPKQIRNNRPSTSERVEDRQIKANENLTIKKVKK